MAAHAQDVLYDLDGVATGDSLGFAVAGAGDVDDDGYDDWIVGAPGDDTAGTSAGRASVYSGFDGALLFQWQGGNAGDLFGSAVASAGDVNNDGHDDLIVGTPWTGDNGVESGSASVYSGVDGSVLYSYDGGAAHDELGQAVNGAGDVNNDGFDDFVIGAPGDNAGAGGAGSVRVYSGANGSLLYNFLGSELLESHGYDVDGAGDVNNDGFDDIIAGGIASSANGPLSGLARVYSGADGSLLFSFPGSTAFEQFGHAVAGVGDVNGDGHDDVAATSKEADNGLGNEGVVRVYSGLDGSLLYEIWGTIARDYFGFSIDGAGDVNGDGYDDFVAGAPVQNTPGVDNGAGSVRLFSGLTGTLLMEVQGQTLGDQRGYSVAGAGDVNGDGTPDVLIGTPKQSDTGSQAGNVLVLSLNTSTWWVDAAALAGGDGSLGLPFQTIQEGVNAASNGERVAVLAGIYQENVRVLANDILIEAVEPGAIIDGGDIAVCVYFSTFDYGQGGNQGLRGFTLTNGNAETFGAGGGGVWISGCSPTIEDCLIENCHGDFGGGLYSQGSAPILRNLTIRNCYARASFQFSRGGGLMLSHASNTLIEDCVIEDNRCDNAAANGGGIYVQLSDDVTIRDTLVLRNAAGADGGGVFARLSSFDLIACEIGENEADDGGGLHFDGNGYNLERSLVYGNSANSTAGMFRGVLTHSVVYGNHGDGVENAGGVFNSIVRANSGASLVNSFNVTYSNIEGSASGTGNINAPALFWAPEGGGVGARDFRLQPLSPCIDSGDPASPLDPDFSPADMGVFPFDASHLPEPEVYCVSHVDTDGCIASVQLGSGSASLSGADSLDIMASDVRTSSMGLMFYGFAPANIPLQNETLCMGAPLQRGSVSSSGGIGTCGGSFSVSFGASQISAAGLGVGDSVYAQFWYRDPGDLQFGSAFSNAAWFVVVP